MHAQGRRRLDLPEDLNQQLRAENWLILPEDMVAPFRLVLHESATNAAKYGALSCEKGHVDLSWSVRDGNNERLVKVVWKEADGPRIGRPGSNGFGTQLIKNGLTAAKVEHEFRPEGIRDSVEFPPSRIPRSG